MTVLIAAGWRPRTGTGVDAAEWVRALLAGGPERGAVLRAGDIPRAQLAVMAGRVVEAVSGRRATWSRWNLHSQACVELAEFRFATAADREEVLGEVVAAAERASVDITAPRLAPVPAGFTRSDGSSVFEARHAALYTSAAVLAAEDYLLARLHDQTGPRAAGRMDAGSGAGELLVDGAGLGADQVMAVEQVAGSGRPVDVLIGPAGAGKTTTLAGLRRLWEGEHGPGSVVGLAPSAATAAVLGAELGIGTDNLAKWLAELEAAPAKRARLASLRTRAAEHAAAAAAAAGAIAAVSADLARWELREGQLVIVDEASLAGTFALARLARAGEVAGAKVLLVGDPLQLAAVEAGGAFSMAAHALGAGAPRLRTVHRFEASWEAEASLLLRLGRPDVVDTYTAHGRVHSGTEAGVIDEAYQAWQADLAAGLSSLLIAGDNETVTMLNQRAQRERIAAGTVTGPMLPLAGGSSVGAGDVIVTRRNERALRAGAGSWVKNGDRWHVLAARVDGSLLVQREGGGPHVTLPGHYVAEHVELGYASTAHRAQGVTVDTAHALVVSAGMAREALYVGMSRGRCSNHVYVATLTISDEEHHARPDDQLTAREVLETVLRSSGAAASAHEAITTSQEAASSIGHLADEYDLIAAAATGARWQELIEAAPLSPAQREAVLASPAWEALSASLRRAARAGTDLERVLPALITGRELDSADDVAAVLHHRLEAFQASAPARRDPAHLVAGLFPAAALTGEGELDEALAERERLIEARARHIAARARAAGHAWAQHDDAAAVTAMVTVAAYRDRWAIDPGDPRPLGGPPGADYTQRADHARAARALRRIHDHPGTGRGLLRSPSAPARARRSGWPVPVTRPRGGALGGGRVRVGQELSGVWERNEVMGLSVIEAILARRLSTGAQISVLETVAEAALIEPGPRGIRLDTVPRIVIDLDGEDWS
ncbi:ATP-dependent RecD-like DNA helicase [Pseudactinotalea sp. HY158]|uniref:ATP-dependent DNA helicase n=1 Tax=Pseudactinotalea sp. HY158 TaxID=2654547 RepID=UPI00129C480C|nr:AAA family ATPase [Pseudactinotalea sp. HY158]QGH70576.1 AAA family ATPase [Pseudactinotalea sp. HY158]